MSGRVILHSDMNGFYASVETMLNPALKGKAIAVCGSTENRHGIVLAKSELAKKAGIKTGMVNWEAKNLCPGLILVPPHYEQYLKYSKLARAIYQRYTDFVEPYGMDECFLDVTGSTKLFGDGMTIAENIRQAIKSELGLTVSIGVSYNKMFAKLGSDMKKPDAITQIKKNQVKEKVWPLPVSDLLFVGRATTKKLKQFGVDTIGDLARLSPDFLQQLLGKNGLGIWIAANGRDESQVMNKDFTSPIKSVGHGITCTEDLLNEVDVWKVMLELCQDIGHKLRIYDLKASGVQLSIRNNELLFKQYQAQLPYATQNPMDLALKARALFHQKYKWHTPVRAVTVRAINLSPKAEPQQVMLFEDISKLDQKERLFEAIEAIRQRFGKRAIYQAVLMGDIKMPDYRDHELTLPGMMNRQMRI